MRQSRPSSAQLRAREAVAALALEFTILTAARTGEVIGATWGEVDLDKAIWTDPSRAHEGGEGASRSAVAARCRNSGSRRSRWARTGCFPADKGGKLSGMAMAMLLRRMKVDAPCTASVRASATGQPNAPAMPTRSAKWRWPMRSSNKVERAYRRGDLFDKRRRLMDDWATYCASDGAAGARSRQSGGRRHERGRNEWPSVQPAARMDRSHCHGRTRACILEKCGSTRMVCNAAPAHCLVWIAAQLEAASGLALILLTGSHRLICALR